MSLSIISVCDSLNDAEMFEGDRWGLACTYETSILHIHEDSL